MKRSRKIILASVLALGISGAVLAVGSHHYCSTMTMQEKSEMFNYYLSRKLDLNSDQEVRLESLSSRVAAILDKVRQERDQREVLIDELLTNQPLDQAALLGRISEKTDYVDQHAPEVVGLLAGFVDSLDAGQKDKLRQMVKQRHGRHGFGHRFGRHHDHGEWIDG